MLTGDLTAWNQFDAWVRHIPLYLL